MKMIKSYFFRFWRQLLIVMSIWAMMIVPGHAVEEGITVSDFSLYQGEGENEYIADIRFDYRLTEYMREGLLNGITMRNQIRFELILHSDWWWNEKEPLDSIVVELKYDALSRQYQLVSKKTGENWNFSNLAAALKHIGSVRKYSLPALPKKAFEGEAAIFIEATMKPVISQSFDLPSKLTSLFTKVENELVSQGVMWPLTP